MASTSYGLPTVDISTKTKQDKLKSFKWTGTDSMNRIRGILVVIDNFWQTNFNLKLIESANEISRNGSGLDIQIVAIDQKDQFRWVVLTPVNSLSIIDEWDDIIVITKPDHLKLVPKSKQKDVVLVDSSSDKIIDFKEILKEKTQNEQ